MLGAGAGARCWSSVLSAQCSVLVLGARCSMLDARCSVLMLGARCSMLGAWCSVLEVASHAQCWMLGARCSMLGARCSRLGAACSVLDARCSVLGARCLVLGASRRCCGKCPGPRRSSSVQWHKRERVQILPDQRSTFRRNCSRCAPHDEAAKRALSNCAPNHAPQCLQRQQSLDEGLDETLTATGSASRGTRTTLKTTKTRFELDPRARGEPYREGRSLEEPRAETRWLATALLDSRTRFERIENYRALPLLREAIRTGTCTRA